MYMVCPSSAHCGAWEQPSPRGPGAPAVQSASSHHSLREEPRQEKGLLLGPGQRAEEMCPEHLAILQSKTEFKTIDLSFDLTIDFAKRT